MTRDLGRRPMLRCDRDVITVCDLSGGGPEVRDETIITFARGLARRNDGTETTVRALSGAGWAVPRPMILVERGSRTLGCAET